jgi:hypothetical protein
VGSAVDCGGEKDCDQELKLYEENETENGFHAEWVTNSNIWDRKTYILDAKENGFYYRIRVKGEGRPIGIRYFSEGITKYEAGGYMLPVAGHADQNASIRTMIQNEKIGLGYMAPPMFCFPFFADGEDSWFGLGLVARQGEYNFDKFVYRSGMKLELPLYGKTYVNGEWESQGIWGGPGEDGISVLKEYAQWHYTEGFCKRGKLESEVPRWWKGPIFCGWCTQQHIGMQSDKMDNSTCGEYTNFDTLGGDEQSRYATQGIYTKISDILDEQRLKPSFIIIDAKWQKEFGSNLPDLCKWTDLRAYTDREHAKGRRVVLWFKAWNNEGLTDEECVMDLCRPVAADPYSPQYQERIKNMMYQLLSSDEGCYNCDGFKIDFANCMPLGYDVHSKGGKYGVELLKGLMMLIYNNAKAVKSDALINCSCGHPYFAEVCDQVRLHDYREDTKLLCSTMIYRKQLFDSAMPGVSVDTDSGGQDSHREFRRYMRLQPELGVPDLYYLVGNHETPMDKEDFDLIREIWNKYIATIDYLEE